MRTTFEFFATPLNSRRSYSKNKIVSIGTPCTGIALRFTVPLLTLTGGLLARMVGGSDVFIAGCGLHYSRLGEIIYTNNNIWAMAIGPTAHASVLGRFIANTPGKMKSLYGST